jgi:Nif-specific regulatory protein
MMARGRFREDLSYRLASFPLSLPDLARRGGDVVLLARHFLEKACLKYGKKVERFSPPALDAMQAYAWPGNVRELENCVERAVLTAKDDCIRTYNLPPAIQGPEFAEDPFRPDEPRTLDEQLDALEKRILEAALRRHGGNRSAAGRELGVSPRMMNYRLKRLGIGARGRDDQ